MSKTKESTNTDQWQCPKEMFLPPDYEAFKNKIRTEPLKKYALINISPIGFAFEYNTVYNLHTYIIEFQGIMYESFNTREFNRKQNKAFKFFFHDYGIELKTSVSAFVRKLAQVQNW